MQTAKVEGKINNKNTKVTDKSTRLGVLILILFTIGMITVLHTSFKVDSIMVNKKSAVDFQIVETTIDAIAYRYGYEDMGNAKNEGIELQNKKNYIERQKLTLSDAEQYLGVKNYTKLTEDEIKQRDNLINIFNVGMLLIFTSFISIFWYREVTLKTK